jgi:MFS family permease
MTVSTAAGALGTMWVHVCSPQPIFNVFLVNHLGASASTLGLLIAIMQVSAVLQLFSVFVYARLPGKKTFWLVFHLLHRMAGLVVMGMAFFVAEGGNKAAAVRWVVVAVAVSWSFMNLSSSGWLSWMADIIPERKRGSFFLRRSAAAQFVTVIWFFSVTLLLDVFPPESTSFVYGCLIGIGGIAGVADILLHLAIPEPGEKKMARDRKEPAKSAKAELADFLAPLSNRNFVRYSVSVGAAVFAMNLTGPFQAPYITSPEAIGAPYTWLGIMTVISQLVWVAIAPFWGVVMDRYGRKPVVLLGCLTTLGWIGFFFLTGRNYTFILPVIALVGGFFGPAFWEGAGQLMLTLAPSANRVSYIAWYNTIVGLVSALSSIIGGAVKDMLGGFSLDAGFIQLRGFHVVLAIALVAIGFAMILINKTGEGKRRSLGDVATQLAGGTLFRSFVSLDALNKVQDSGRVASALRRIEDGSGALLLDEILERLDDPSPEVREEAARALGRIGSAEAVGALSSRLSDEDGMIRIEAARALGKIGDRQAVPALADALSSPSAELRAACAEALGCIGDDESIEALLSAFRSGREDSVIVMGTEAASRSGEGAEGGEARFEIFQAVWELFPRFISTANTVLQRQYATAIANLIGKPGEFYQYMTGGETERLARCRVLKTRFDAKMRELLSRPQERQSGAAGARDAVAREQRADGQRGAALEAALAIISEAMESGRWKEGLSSLFSLSDAVMDRLFGAQARDREFFAHLLGIDIRMATWWWLARESKRLDQEFDEGAAGILLHLGIYFLQRL